MPLPHETALAICETTNLNVDYPLSEADVSEAVRRVMAAESRKEILEAVRSVFGPKIEAIKAARQDALIDRHSV